MCRCSEEQQGGVGVFVTNATCGVLVTGGRLDCVVALGRLTLGHRATGLRQAPAATGRPRPSHHDPALELDQERPNCLSLESRGAESEPSACLPYRLWPPAVRPVLARGPPQAGRRRGALITLRARWRCGPLWRPPPGPRGAPTGQSTPRRARPPPASASSSSRRARRASKSPRLRSRRPRRSAGRSTYSTPTVTPETTQGW